MKTKQVMTLTGALILSMATHGAPIAHEGFDYTEPNGTSVAGLNGGTGWTEPFPTPTGVHTLTDGLSFTGVASSGKAMIRTGGDLTTDGRNWSTSVNTNATYWYSFLLNVAQGAATGGTFGLFQIKGDFQNGIGIVIRGGGTNYTIAATTHYEGNLLTANFAQTYLVIGNINHSRNTVWLYSAADGVPAEAPTGNGMTTARTGSSGEGGLSGKNAAFYGRAWGATTAITIDEIRLGTEFTDVIFEPATIGLIGITGIADDGSR